jgi:hypothetical protein
MPVIGRLIGGLDFTNYFIALSPIPAERPDHPRGGEKAGVPVIAGATSSTSLINFVILAFVVFLMVKQINRLQARAPPAAPAARPRTSSCCARSATRSRASAAAATMGVSPSLMRKLWLVFAQAVTLTLAALFVVSLVKPDWLAWRAQVVEVREAAPRRRRRPRRSARAPSFSEAAKKAIPRW